MTSRQPKKASRLGRGLDSLLGPPPPKSDLFFLDIESLSPSESQPRRHFDSGELRELAGSIKSHGLLQPVLARPAPGKAGAYQIIAGERRWRAAGLAGLSKIPVIVKKPGPREAALWSLLENLQRKDLNPMEEARAFKAILEGQGLSQEELASRLGISRPAIANSLRLLQLGPEVQRAVEEGKISFAQAREILRAKSSKQQKDLARLARQGMTVQGLASRFRPAREKPAAGKASLAKRPPHWAAAAKARLERKLFKKISIELSPERKPGSKKGHGRLSIFFESEKDLKDLLDRLIRGGR